jgi:hypothetical protein
LTIENGEWRIENNRTRAYILYLKNIMERTLRKGLEPVRIIFFKFGKCTHKTTKALKKPKLMIL